MANNNEKKRDEKYLPYLSSVIPKNAYFVELRDNKSGLSIFIGDEDKKENVITEIRFPSICGYTNIDEGYRLTLLDNLPPPPRGSVYTVIDSKFLNSFHEENKQLFVFKKIAHYLILTSDDCIDVLTEVEPIITIVSDKQFED